MPNTRVAVLYDREGTPIDACCYNEEDRWALGYIARNMEPGDELNTYERRLTAEEQKQLREAAEEAERVAANATNRATNDDDVAF